MGQNAMNNKYMTIEFKKTVQAWDSLIKDNHAALSSSLSELEFSALASWPSDCFDSFMDIIVLLSEMNGAIKLENTLHQNVVEIFWQLDHIRTHIEDAKNGFVCLMNVIGAKETSGKE